jgi:hypothetical protein
VSEESETPGEEIGVLTDDVSQGREVVKVLTAGSSDAQIAQAAIDALLDAPDLADAAFAMAARELAEAKGPESA